MIIDSHCHIWDKSIISGSFKKLIDDGAKQMGLSDPSTLYDGSAERLIREMEEAGIDKTVILALDGHIAFTANLTYKDYNNYVANIVNEYPDKLIGFAGIDPRRGKEAIQELERCVELGLKGLKLWPLTGFYPDDLNFYPFYKRVQELELPVLMHTGSGPPNTYIKYCQPIYVDKVAIDFPDMKIIMAHMGDPFTILTFILTSLRGNQS
jgi:predicted TIM-barrel fold metal-dependent hydrolase